MGIYMMTLQNQSPMDLEKFKTFAPLNVIKSHLHVLITITTVICLLMTGEQPQWQHIT